MTRLRKLAWLTLVTLVGCGGSGGSGNEAETRHPDDEATRDATASMPEDGEAIEDSATQHGEHYTMTYPAGWTLVEPPPEGVDSLANAPAEGEDDFQERLNVVVQKLPQPMTTPEFGLAVTSGMQQMVKGFSLISTGEFRLKGGVQAVEAVYKSNFQQELHHIVVMLVDAAGRGYVITGTATPESFTDFAPTFRKSIRSFKLKK